MLALHQRDKRQTSEAGVKHEDDDEAPARLPRLRRRATWVSAHRVDFNVYYRRLEREEFVTLDAIREGRPLIEALESGFAESRIGRGAEAVAGAGVVHGVGGAGVDLCAGSGRTDSELEGKHAKAGRLICHLL